MKKIKIKDLKKGAILDGMTLCVPLHLRKQYPELAPKMIIKSGWIKGLWCQKKSGDARIYPVFFKDYNEVKEWYVVDR